MNGLGNVVSHNKMEHLGVEHIIDVEHHLGEQPIVVAILGCIDKILPFVGLDGQWQEIS